MWSDEVKRNGLEDASLKKVIWKFTRSRIMVNIILYFMSLIFGFVGPVVILVGQYFILNISIVNKNVDLLYESTAEILSRPRPGVVARRFMGGWNGLVGVDAGPPLWRRMGHRLQNGPPTKIGRNDDALQESDTTLLIGRQIHRRSALFNNRPIQ